MNWLAKAARDLSPAYFALVMATGIVSIASDRAGFPRIAAVLLWLNAVQYRGALDSHVVAAPALPPSTA